MTNASTDLAFSPLERMTHAPPPGGEYQTGSRPLAVSEFRVAVVQ